MSKVEIVLYNGFFYPEQAQEIDDWGFEGPGLGPFDMVQITYGQHIKCYTGNGEILDLMLENDFIVYKGKFYGDMLIRPCQNS